MSKGKKWLMTEKQSHRQPHSRRYRYKVMGGKKGKCRFKFFRHKKYFKSADGHISMRRAASKELWYWD